MIEFVWPQTNGEWLAWSGALYLVVSGLVMFLVPRLWLSVTGSLDNAGGATAIGLMRGPLAGGNIGLGLAVIALHPQPLLYLGLAAMLLFRATARLVSIVFDGGNRRYGWLALIIEGLLGLFSLAYAFGIIA